MIQKKKEVYTSVEGAGRPFEMNERYPIEKNDAERQRPVIIDLDDLNGQDGGKGMPKNFHRKAGRTLVSFDKYWTRAAIDAELGEEFDIE
jgi:hypothetical protein